MVSLVIFKQKPDADCYFGGSASAASVASVASVASATSLASLALLRTLPYRKVELKVDCDSG